MVTAWVLIVVAVGLLGYFVLDDIREFARFKALTYTEARQRRYRVWIVKALLLFVGFALVALALLGRIDALWSMPAEFAPLRTDLPSTGFLLILCVAIVGGGVAGTVIATRLNAQSVTLGDFDAIIPRNGAERWHGAALSLNAGVTEEIFFRLLLPLLLTIVIGNPLTAFIVAGVLFGLAHAYQGLMGVLATGAVSALFAILYLGSGALWLPILVHVLIDLNGLILRPLLSGAFAKNSRK